MTFRSRPSEQLRKTLSRLKKKDHALFRVVQKKMRQIASCDERSIEHFKNLRHDQSHLKRVRIGSFILTFCVKGDTIFFEDMEHHDRAYRR